MRAQSDSEFELCIGTDGLDVDDLAALVGERPLGRWIVAPSGATVAQVRNHPLAVLCRHYDVLVCADVDDMLEPSRVAAARQAIADADVAGCAMRVVDEHGADTGVVFDAPPSAELSQFVVHRNVFGLGNSVYRTDLLRELLPIPAPCVANDWFLITRAVARSARLDFDHVPRAAYRQYGGNTARVLPPFTPEQVLGAARLVAQHYVLVAQHIPELLDTLRNALCSAASRADAFLAAIADPSTLQNYVAALDALPPVHVWWDCVAHPELDGLWCSKRACGGRP